MEIKLRICTCNHKNNISDSIIFFSAKKWNLSSESKVLKFLPQIFNNVKRFSKDIQIEIKINTNQSAKLITDISKDKITPDKGEIYKLTPREYEILSHITSGLTNKEIAKKLFISYETVKTHRKHILEKTECNNIAMLINKYNLIE